MRLFEFRCGQSRVHERHSEIVPFQPVHRREVSVYALSGIVADAAAPGPHDQVDVVLRTVQPFSRVVRPGGVAFVSQVDVILLLDESARTPHVREAATGTGLPPVGTADLSRHTWTNTPRLRSSPSMKSSTSRMGSPGSADAPRSHRVRPKYSSGFKAISMLSLRCNKPRISPAGNGPYWRQRQTRLRPNHTNWGRTQSCRRKTWFTPSGQSSSR